MNFSVASLHTVLEALVPDEVRGLVVALSGGPDSAALLTAMADPGGSFRRLPLRAVHIDHGLQAAAQGFREACIALCRHLGVPLNIIAAEVHAEAGASLEAAARDARYAALAAQTQPGECLLTAHHRADQAETVLLQALRGAGVKGMSAMPGCRVFGAGWHVRPLLEVARSDVRRFGEALREFRAADPMNEDLRFDRVYLRTEIWPLLEKRWPGADTALARSARHLAEAQQLLDEAAAAEVARLRDGEALSVPGLRALSAVKRANAVRWWLNESGAELPSSVRLAEALRQIFDADQDQQPSIVWGGMALRRYRQRMFVTAAQPPRLPDARPWTVAMGECVDLGPQLGNLSFVARRGALAAERLPPALSVRRRAGGETIRPARSAKTQTLQHLCQSRGVLPWLRDALPLVFAGDELIAVADLWMDGRWCAAPDAPGLGIAWNDAPFVT